VVVGGWWWVVGARRDACALGGAVAPAPMECSEKWALVREERGLRLLGPGESHGRAGRAAGPQESQARALVELGPQVNAASASAGCQAEGSFQV
jgi:hypothetical protein